MYKIFYTPKSEEKLAEIFWYISQDSLFYATKVIVSIKNTIDILKLFPLSWKDIGKINKIVVESKYKFKIIYRIKWDTIYIISVFKYKNSWE